MNAHEQPVEDIIGFPVTRLSREGCCDLIAGWLAEIDGGPRIFACANPHSLHVASFDPDFRQALMAADLLTPDGIGIVIGSRLLGGSITRRITGHDVFEDTCKVLDRQGGSCFFLGSTKDVLAKIRIRMAADYPNIRVAGTFSPPYRARFSEAENEDMLGAINDAAPDVLWVGMTAPKQEKWLQQNRHRLNLRFAGAIGAVFDFYVGTVPRSSPLFRRMGLEWLPRLLRQPRRLWRRNFISNPAFVAQVLRSRWRRKN